MGKEGVSDSRPYDCANVVDRNSARIASVSAAHQSLDQQTDALAAAGVDATRIYTDELTGTSTRLQRPGLAALLDYARKGDAIVVVGIDRLGRNTAEVMTTIRNLGERGIVLRSLRERIDTSNASGPMVAGLLASLAELELELGKERRTAARDARRGAWAVHRSSEGSRRLQDRVGAAHACGWRVGQHYRQGAWRQSCNCLPGLGR